MRQLAINNVIAMTTRDVTSAILDVVRSFYCGNFGLYHIWTHQVKMPTALSLLFAIDSYIKLFNLNESLAVNSFTPAFYVSYAIFT